MKVGFTGTRLGLDDETKAQIKKILVEFKATEVYHGMCVGADNDFHDICRELGLKIHGLPGYSKTNPTDRQHRVDLDVDVLHLENTHFARNREIVISSDLMIACPICGVTTGGTMYTYHYAMQNNKPTILLCQKQ